MTALKGKAIDAFVARRDPAIFAVLVYGPDLGLVRERADKIARQVCPDFKDPFNYLELSDGDLKSEPSRLADELVAFSMIGGMRLVRIRTSGDSATAAATLVVAGLESGHLKPTGVAVIEAGDLSRTAKLRRLFESSKAAVAVPCYADAPADVRALAVDAARAANLRFDAEALDLLATLLGEDRGVSRAEIDKLILFKGPEDARSGFATITLDDVKAVLVDTVSDAADEAAAAAADGAAPRLARALHRLAGAGAGAVGTARALQRQFLRLRAAAIHMREGAGAEAAMARLRPPVHFMEKRAFEARLSRWSLEQIDAALDLLLEAELGAKTTGFPDGEIVERAAFRIAALAGR